MIAGVQKLRVGCRSKAAGSVSGSLSPWAVALAVLCAGSLWLRIEHVRGIMPYIHHIDELLVSTQAAQMVMTGDFKPKDMLYPSLPKYLAAAGMYFGFLCEAAAGTMDEIGEIGNVGYPYYETPKVVAVARYLFAFLSVGTLAAVGIAAWLLLGRPSALLLAPLVLATSQSFLRLATKYLNVDNVGTCFVIAGVAALLHGTRHPSTRCLALVPAIFVGLAAGSKYTHGLLLGPVLVAIFLFAERRQWYVALGAALTASAGAFIVVVPYSVLDFQLLFEALTWQATTYATGWHGGNEANPGLEQLVRYTRYFVKEIGIGALLLSAIGIITAARRDWRRTLVVVMFPVMLFLLFVAQRVHFVRNMLPILPFFAVFTVAGLYVLHRWIMVASKGLSHTSLELQHVLRIGAWPVLIAVFLSVPFGKLLSHLQISSDSRHSAVAWIRENVPTSSTIIVPESLGLDPRPLEKQGYPVRKMDFVSLDTSGSLRTAINRTLGPVAVLIPTWGRDPRFEGEELALKLNAAAAQFQPVASFGERPVLVNYRYPVVEPDPRFGIVVR